MSAKNPKKKTVQNSGAQKKWLPILALVVITFLYYGNTLKNGFSLDDDLVTTTDNSRHKRVEKGVSAIPEIFRTHYVSNDKQKYEYRPFVTSSFAIEYSLFGHKSIKDRASISHLISVMLYALLIVLIYLLIFKLFPDKNWLFPFLVALLFLIHPIHSEVVNNIKCRDELFVMIFGLLAMFSFLKYIDSGYEKWGYVVTGVLAILVSILSKKVGVAFVVLIPVTLFYFRDIKIKKLMLFFSVMLMGFVVFILLKKGALTEGNVREKMFFENPLYFSESFVERIPMFFYSIVFYLKMMVVPAPLVYYYGYAQVEIETWSNPLVWVGVLFVLGGVFFTIKRLAKKEMWAFGFLFFMFGVGGGANLLFPAVGIVAERFVFTGSFGLIFIVAYYGFQLYEKQKQGKSKFAFYSIGAAVVILSFSQVVSRNKDWSTRFSLYNNDIKNLSKSAKAHSLLGTEYTSRADSVSRTPNSSYADYMSYIDSAIAEFKVGLEIYDGYYNCANNAGALYFTRKKDHYKAKPLFKNAIETKPDYVEALFNYGNCFEYELKGIKELQLIFNKIRPDSLASDFVKKSDNEYLVERKAAFAVYMIKNEILSVLTKLNLKVPNWQNIAIYQIMLSITTHSEVEQGAFQSSFDKKAFEGVVRDYFNKTTQINAQMQLQQLMSYTEMTLYQAVEKNVKEVVARDSNYFNNAFVDLSALKNAKRDSAELYWVKSLKKDSTYYYSYKSLTALYLGEQQFDKVIEINKKAIEKGGFKDNTEFYMNIGNVYNSKSDFTNAVKTMEEAIAEIDMRYAQMFNNEKVDAGRKQGVLTDLLNRKKQIYGFIANIYYSAGNQAEFARYQQLMQSM